MIRIFFVCFLTVSAMKSNCQSKIDGASVENFKPFATYEYAKAHISFEYPAYWLTRKEDKAIFVVDEKRYAPSDKFSENIVFSNFRTKVPLRMPLDTLTFIISEYLLKTRQNCKLLQQSVYKNANGVLVGQFEVTFIENGLEVSSIQCFFRKGTGVFSLGFTTENRMINNYRKLYDLILNSLTL